MRWSSRLLCVWILLVAGMVVIYVPAGRSFDLDKPFSEESSTAGQRVGDGIASSGEDDTSRERILKSSWHLSSTLLEELLREMVGLESGACLCIPC